MYVEAELLEWKYITKKLGKVLASVENMTKSMVIIRISSFNFSFIE